MRTILCTAAFVLALLGANAQTIPLATYKALNDSVIARYNRNDFKGIYALGNDFFKSIQSEADCIDNFQSEKKNTGDIVSTEMIEDLGKVKFFRWTGKTKNVKFELRVEDEKIKNYDFNQLIQQPGDLVKAVPTDNPLKTFLDSVVHRYALIYMGDPRANSLSIGIYQNGQKHLYNYGEVKKGSGILPTSNTIYTTGSIAKTFIGILLAKAVVDKKVGLEDDVRKYLKGNYPNLEYKGHPVRLVDLANHTGGFRKFNIISLPDDFNKWDPDKQANYFYTYPDTKFYEDLHKLKIETMPGTDRFYSVSGIIILGIVLENAYHRPLEQLFREYYSNNFAMKDTKLNADPGDLKRAATPYDDKGQPLSSKYISTLAMICVISTPGDMMKYMEANIREKDINILLSHKPTWGNPRYFSVGLVWQVLDGWEKDRWVFHSGHDAGYNSLCSTYPDIGLGFMFFQNEDGRQGLLYDMENDLFQSLENHKK